MAVPPFQVKALYDYSSKEEDDLNFRNGQILIVTDVEDDDWYFGEYTDSDAQKQEGLFPKNFVKIFEPETPPRPSRTNKSKKEFESIAPAKDAEKNLDTEKIESSSSTAVHGPAQIEQDASQEIEQEVPQQPEPQSTKPAPITAVPPQPLATKPALPASTKPAPPPTAEKPGPGSFRDRINAFNKPAAPPVAPMKPSALGSSSGSGFVKKPFVAPPPSKNAYVPPPREAPPQKVYRREEDPELAAPVSKDIETQEPSFQSQTLPSAAEEEDQPKPTSLKDRIALLQKQQMEQAARQAEAAQKKEKQKRPAKKHMESEEHAADQAEDVEDARLERINSGDTTGGKSVESYRDVPPPLPRSNTQPRKSREATPVGSPVTLPPRELMSDPNDADQSGLGDTEEGDELSTGRDDSDEKPQRKASVPLPRPSQAPIREADVGDEEDNADENPEEEEDDDMDPEVKRRMEIRERMAKMSGGMGMAGMFGPSGGMPARSSAKQASTSNDRKASSNSVSGQGDSPVSRAPPVPMMPMPGLSKVRSPEQSEAPLEVSKEATDTPKSLVQGRDPEEMPDVEDLKEEPIPPTRRSMERSTAPPIPQDRPVPAPSGQGRQPPPPLPAERPIPPPHSDAILRPPPNQPLSPSEGSESDDEMSLHTRSSLRLPPGSDSRPSSRGGPPPLPSAAPPQPLPSRPAAPQSRSSELGRSADLQTMEMSPTSPIASANPASRNSRVPPIPDSSPAMAFMPQTRAPPPPPPSNAPLPRVPTGEGRAPPIPPLVQKERDLGSDEEGTEYEGDYDTDMASSAPRKEALKSHARVPSLEDDSMTDETSLHHSGLPSLGPTPSSAPRAVPPPPPPHQPLKTSRQSSDMPRAAPPPPPPPKAPTQENDDSEYDPFNYANCGQRFPLDSQRNMESPVTPRIEDPDPMMSASPSHRAVPPPGVPNQSQYAASPNLSGPLGSSTGTRQSMDVQRNSATMRRSTDGPRPSGEHGFIAGDVDLGHASQWWARPDTPPPIFQNRQDLVFEVEETSTTRRGGKQAITKIVYVLFMDYSQTVITAHFETREPSNASLEQRHEPPPPNLRQDQLETAHARFGARIAEGAASKENSVVGNGSPNAIVLDLLSSLPEALLPVGVRAYGALVYANLANASVRQFDEIRPGDIVTFRNAKFAGHRGAMHSKYTNEVGKPDHVGVVIDWDGTKKKVRAWEQGRESKKVKAESFKLGDMRSGEVKVWRVMARSWVGWEGQN